MLKRTPMKRPDPPEGDNAENKAVNNRNDPSSSSGKLRGKRGALRVLILFVLVSLASLGFRVSKNHNASSVFRLRGGAGDNDISLAKSATTTVISKKKKKKAQNTDPSKQHNNKCRYYLAESAIPNGGLGMFTAIDIREGEEAQSLADICIFVLDYPKGFGSHSFGRGMWHGKFEGDGKIKSACEGFATLFNTMPKENNVRTSRLFHFAKHNDNGGLHRAKSPGAGAITQYVGISSVAARNIEAGSELTFDYDDWKFDPDKEYIPPTRTVEWLETNGMCVDNIKIQRATDPRMGRGAFATRHLPKGSVVVPAPVQMYPNRTQLAFKEAPHQENLFVNYCLQPKGLDMLLYPYGPGVNLINHASDEKKANVEFRWSTNHAHHSQWLELPMSEFWDTVYHGSLILDVVALRDVSEDEELFLDYGRDFEAAWKEHAAKWVPVDGAGDYVYPNDMDIGPSVPFRTVEEQKTNPYPENLATICEPNFAKKDRGEGFQPRRWKQRNDYNWPEGRYLCHVLKREIKKNGDGFEYEVSMGWHSEFEKDDLEYVIRGVPHRAIMFVEHKPYTSDAYLPNAFRHPIAFPDKLVPDPWRSWH